jgi:hypothetical protein
MESLTKLRTEHDEKYSTELSAIVNDNKEITQDKFQLLKNYILFLNQFCSDLKTFIEKKYSNTMSHDEKIKFLHEELSEENFLKATKKMYFDVIIKNELFKGIDLAKEFKMINNNKENNICFHKDEKANEILFYNEMIISIFNDLKACENNVNSVLTVKENIIKEEIKL